MLIVVVLLVTVLMRFAIVTAVVYLLLPAGPLCPHCKIDMVPIRNRFFDRLLPALQRRWCLSCGWNGVGGAPRNRRAMLAAAVSAIWRATGAIIGRGCPSASRYAASPMTEISGWPATSSVDLITTRP